MTIVASIAILLCFAVEFLHAQSCVPTDVQYSSGGTTIYLSWSYEEESDDCTGAIILSKLGTTLTYDYTFDAVISLPSYCTTYEIGIMPYSEGGMTGTVQYFNVTTGTPYNVNMDHVSIKKNDTYIRAEWAGDDETKNCIEEYQVVLSIANHPSPLDIKSLKQMSLFHKQASTSYDIMPLEDCVNNKISINVAPYYDGYTGEYVEDTLVCD